jgi:hypothetical protein
MYIRFVTGHFNVNTLRLWMRTVVASTTEVLYPREDDAGDAT